MTATPQMIMERFHLEAPPPVPNKGEMRPTDQALVVGQHGAVLLPWGLSTDWSNQPLINARSETLAEKATFTPLLEQRCLVPMTAYFEWRKDGGAKLKNTIQPRNLDLAAFAGLTNGEAFTIATCSPAPSIAHIHNRMPVILSGDEAVTWADPSQRFDRVKVLLRPFEGDLQAEEDIPPPPAQADLFH